MEYRGFQIGRFKCAFHLTAGTTLRAFCVLAAFLLSHIAASAQEDSATAVADSVGKPNLINRIIDYFASANKSKLTRRPNFSFVGGPHYSSDTKLGLGLLAAGLYSTEPSDSVINPSNITLFTDITTGGYFKIGIEGLHIYAKDSRRIDYEVSFNSYSTYFWGIGYDAGISDDNKGKYMLFDVHVDADHLWRVFNGVYVGPTADFDYISARDVKRPDTWEGLKRSSASFGVGARIQYDTRDNYTAPQRGWFAEFTQRFYPKAFGNGNQNFASTEAALNKYASVWKGGVIASRIHACLTYGNTPWGLMPTLGDHGTMRGYYEGQYRDKCEFDATIELRQKVWGRSGIAAWGGIGSVFPSFKSFRSRYILPSYGVGYRWEFKKNTNIRVDVGFGKKCWGVEFNLNEAF